MDIAGVCLFNDQDRFSNDGPPPPNSNGSPSIKNSSPKSPKSFKRETDSLVVPALVADSPKQARDLFRLAQHISTELHSMHFELDSANADAECACETIERNVVALAERVSQDVARIDNCFKESEVRVCELKTELDRIEGCYTDLKSSVSQAAKEAQGMQDRLESIESRAPRWAQSLFDRLELIESQASKWALVRDLEKVECSSKNAETGVSQFKSELQQINEILWREEQRLNTAVASVTALTRREKEETERRAQHESSMLQLQQSIERLQAQQESQMAHSKGQERQDAADIRLLREIVEQLQEQSAALSTRTLTLEEFFTQGFVASTRSALERLEHELTNVREEAHRSGTASDLAQQLVAEATQKSCNIHRAAAIEDSVQRLSEQVQEQLQDGGTRLRLKNVEQRLDRLSILVDGIHNMRERTLSRNSDDAMLFSPLRRSSEAEGVSPRSSVGMTSVPFRRSSPRLEPVGSPRNLVGSVWTVSPRNSRNSSPRSTPANPGLQFPVATSISDVSHVNHQVNPPTHSSPRHPSPLLALSDTGIHALQSPSYPRSWLSGRESLESTGSSLDLRGGSASRNSGTPGAETKAHSSGLLSGVDWRVAEDHLAQEPAPHPGHRYLRPGLFHTAVKSL